MAQLVQLQKNLSAFNQAGIEVVALTYDDPALQQAFIDKNHIEYPFLSDVDAYTVKKLGILNEQYEPGDGAYGIPYPGIFVLDNQMNIVGKIFLHGYETRVNAQAVLAYAIERLR